MKKKMAVLLAAGLMAGVLAPQPSRQVRAQNPPAPALKVGDEAPDFTLKYFDGTDLKSVSLHDYRGKKNVVLAFYIFAFTGG
jgi:cytochrome oxidase Cu insertion factor (SCO1/SenC/PrrC family)